MSVVTSFMNDYNNATGASRSRTYCNKRSTLLSKVLQKAFRSLISDEPTKHVIRKHAKAVTKPPERLHKVHTTDLP
ncbi:hypothetical protein HW555_009042 [Spodoptera exigua]|uniref:Uncharacterized protein n=1 Tax=Spodoptera exigua TaxID=7107 RepID=A0A835G9M3_SPOEX|nr:hypothetical protein HW555_009042 [Spodoptera exigua]